MQRRNEAGTERASFADGAESRTDPRPGSALERRLRADATRARRPAPAALRERVLTRLERGPVRPRPAAPRRLVPLALAGAAAAALVAASLLFPRPEAPDPSAGAADPGAALAEVRPAETARPEPPDSPGRPVPSPPRPFELPRLSLPPRFEAAALAEAVDAPLVAEAQLLFADAERFAAGLVRGLPAPPRRERPAGEHDG